MAWDGQQPELTLDQFQIVVVNRPDYNKKRPFLKNLERAMLTGKRVNPLR